MSTSAGSRLPYMVFVVAKFIDPYPFNTCGPSEDPLCHDERVRQEVKGLRECPEALGIFQMDSKTICRFWSLIKTHHLLVCNIINMMPYNGCSQCCTVSLKTEKPFIAHPWCLLCVVGLEEYSAHDWRVATSGTARSSYLARVGPVHRRNTPSAKLPSLTALTGGSLICLLNSPLPQGYCSAAVFDFYAGPSARGRQLCWVSRGLSGAVSINK